MFHLAAFPEKLPVLASQKRQNEGGKTERLWKQNTGYLNRAKVRAGMDADEQVRVRSYPGGSMLDMLRPKPSSQPAAASLPQAVAALLGQSVAGVLDQAQKSLTGAQAMWLGEYRF